MNSYLRLARGVLVFALVLAAGQGVASAATLTYQPNPTDLQDLDHTYMYTWRITSLDTVIPSGQVVTGASLFFDNIANWNNNPNKLFLHLLDTALTTGTQIGTTSSGGVTSTVYRAVDDSSGTTISDAFAVKPNGSNSLDYYTSTNGLVADNTKNTVLGNFTSTDSTTGRVSSWIGQNSNYSFSTTPVDYKYDFTASQIAKLNEYIASRGDMALALDPDGHFFNDGITLTLTTGPPPTPNPEPATLTLLGLGLGAAYARRRRATRRASAVTL